MPGVDTASSLKQKLAVHAVICNDGKQARRQKRHAKQVKTPHQTPSDTAINGHEGSMRERGGFIPCIGGVGGLKKTKK